MAAPKSAHSGPPPSEQAFQFATWSGTTGWFKLREELEEAALPESGSESEDLTPHNTFDYTEIARSEGTLRMCTSSAFFGSLESVDWGERSPFLEDCASPHATFDLSGIPMQYASHEEAFLACFACARDYMHVQHAPPI